MWIKAHRDCLESVTNLCRQLNEDYLRLDKKTTSIVQNNFEFGLKTIKRLQQIEEHLGMKYIEQKLIPIKKCETCHREIKGEKENV